MFKFLLTASACAALLVPPQLNAQAAERPNVIVILSDDQGWGDLSLNGNSNLSTPHIDSIGRRGTRFDRFFVSPVCAPTRAEFLTGRYHPRGGVHDVSRGGERLNLDERTIAQAFKEAGYKTAGYGKWHNGMQYPYHPLARGFDDFYGFCSGHWGDYFSPQLEHNGELVQGNGYLVDDFTEHALKFIEENQANNFFLYLPMPTPHTPMQVPDAYWDRMKQKALTLKARPEDPEDEGFTRAALAMVECIDHNVGRVLNKLDELKLAHDTIVVYFSDNGPNSFRWNGDMKGRKGSTDEGGVRSPLLISWPGTIQAGRVVPHICGAIDLLPTLADLADIPLAKPSKPLDGVSLAPLLKDAAAVIADRMIFSHWNGRVSVRTQQYRLDHRGQLYDMLDDPGQLQPITTQQPHVALELQTYVDKWKTELLTGLKDVHRPFTIGHPDFPLTQLPARDGQPQGGIQRSNKAPNCSYFTNWNNTQDTMVWPVEVLTEGSYEVEMYYTCPPALVGAEVELTLGESQLRATIDAVNDPPQMGAQHDRVARNTESLVKDFKPLNLGVVHLKAGQGALTLRASQLPSGGANETLEMRLFMFRRVR